MVGSNMDKGKRRSAVLVGCNYPGTRYELRGCINDVRAMRQALVERFGFEAGSVEVLTDAPGSPVMPTGANVRAALHRMVDRAEQGDVLFFHFSGHGTRIPSARLVFPFKKDEAIVPCDFNLITDVDFRHLVNRLPKGATFTIFSDSCHSGGLIDKEKEQIGPSAAHAHAHAHGTSVFSAPKHIPFESLLQHLSSQTHITTSDIGTHQLESFGAEASLRFRLAPLEAAAPFVPLKLDEGILLSGCQANETSADMEPSAAEGGKSYGAFSDAIQTVLKENKRRLSNREVVVLAREVLRRRGFGQHPCLYCSDENADASFLGQD